MTASVEFTIPGLRLPTQPSRTHWAVTARMVREQRQVVALSFLAHVGRRFKPAPPYHVTLTRVGPRKPDWSNVVASLKHVQDELAQWLRVDDGDTSKVHWGYDSAIGDYAVRVRIKALTGPHGWPATGVQEGSNHGQDCTEQRGCSEGEAPRQAA